jgi:hypothetical protein
MSRQQAKRTATTGVMTNRSGRLREAALARMPIPKKTVIAQRAGGVGYS